MARVHHVSESDLDPEYHDLLFSGLQPDKKVNVYASVGNNPEILSGLRTFLGTVWSDSGLTDRQRELVILAVADQIGSEYEWQQHVNIATKLGLEEAEIVAVSTGDLDRFTPEERLLTEYARAVVDGEVTDELHADLAERFDDETIVGIAAAAAGYLTFGRIVGALGVETESSFVGWELE